MTPAYGTKHSANPATIVDGEPPDLAATATPPVMHPCRVRHRAKSAPSRRTLIGRNGDVFGGLVAGIGNDSVSTGIFNLGGD